MTPLNVSPSLYINTVEDETIIESFLFQVSIHFSREGRRVLYIAPRQIERLPPIINDGELDHDAVRLITFMYVADKNSLLKYLTTAHQINKPPSALLVHQLDFYTSSPEDTDVPALLLHAASVFGSKTGRKTTLVTSVTMPVAPILIQRYFHNVWCVFQEGGGVILKNISEDNDDRPAELHFDLHREPDRLILAKVFKTSN